MNVFLFAETDNAQQNYLLAKAMRDHLGWNAKSMVLRETYLGYPTDWTFDKDLGAAQEFMDDADLFILQDGMVFTDELPLHKYCGIHNTIINGTGSRLRNNIAWARAMQAEGWAIVPMLCDSTLSSLISAPPFENWIVPIERIKELTAGIEKNEKFSVCHAPTKLGHKGTERFEAALQPLIDAGEVEYERITGVPWEEAIKRKAKHHLILDSLGDTHYNAGNSLEGLAIGQMVMTRMDGWCRVLHDDNPIGRLTGKETTDEMRTMIQHRIEGYKMYGSIEVLQQTRKRWVTKHFGSDNQIRKWRKYIEWVMER